MSPLISSSVLADNHTYADTNSKHESRQDVNRWVPAFAFVGAFHGQGQKSSVSSSCDIGGPPTENDLPLPVCSQVGEIGRPGPPIEFDTPTAMRRSNAGKEFGLWPGVGVDVQLMTPRIPKIDILPFDIGIRGFVSGEVMAVFGPSRATANEGDAGELLFPEDQPELDSYPSSAISGTGSEVRSEQDTFEFAAAIGISIPINILNRTVRIKPSFGWLNYKLKISGRLVHAIKDDVNGSLPGGNPLTGSFGANTRAIDLQKNLTKNINAIGTGVEVELESGKFGPIGAAVFASIHGYKVVGDRKFKFKGSQTFEDGTIAAGGDGLLEDTYRAAWEHEIDPWIYRMKVGLRFHYVGE